MQILDLKVDDFIKILFDELKILDKSNEQSNEIKWIGGEENYEKVKYLINNYEKIIENIKGYRHLAKNFKKN